MASIKSFRYGSRTILVIEDCVGETAEIIERFLHDLIAEQSMKPMSAPDIFPSTVPLPEEPPAVEQEIIGQDFDEAVEELPVNGKTATLGEAIAQNDTRAIVDLCLRVSLLNEKLQPSALALCKEYIRYDCSQRIPETAPVKEIREFFALYKPLIASTVKEILEMLGCSSVKELFANCEEYVLQDAYRTVLDNLVQRISE